jgi:hypothetical protein
MSDSTRPSIGSRLTSAAPGPPAFNDLDHTIQYAGMSRIWERVPRSDKESSVHPVWRHGRNGNYPLHFG